MKVYRSFLVLERGRRGGEGGEGEWEGEGGGWGEGRWEGVREEVGLAKEPFLMMLEAKEVVQQGKGWGRPGNGQFFWRNI